MASFHRPFEKSGFLKGKSNRLKLNVDVDVVAIDFRIMLVARVGNRRDLKLIGGIMGFHSRAIKFLRRLEIVAMLVPRRFCSLYFIFMLVLNSVRLITFAEGLYFAVFRTSNRSI